MPKLAQLTSAFKGITVHDSFKQVVNQFASQPYFVKNRKGEFTYANSIFLEHCRVDSLDRILGKIDYDFFPSVLANKYEKDDSGIFETGKPIFNLVELSPGICCAPSWKTVHKVPLYDEEGGIYGLIGTFEALLNESTQESPKTAALVPAINYIRKNYSQRVDMTSLANLCNMSERTFYRHFKDVFSITPQNYLQKHRVLEALEIFRIDYSSIAEVAVKCGFYDHSNFTKEFKKHMSITPRQYIRQMKPAV